MLGRMTQHTRAGLKRQHLHQATRPEGWHHCGRSGSLAASRTSKLEGPAEWQLNREAACRRPSRPEGRHHWGRGGSLAAQWRRSLPPSQQAGGTASLEQEQRMAASLPPSQQAGGQASRQLGALVGHAPHAVWVGHKAELLVEGHHVGLCRGQGGGCGAAKGGSE